MPGRDVYWKSGVPWDNLMLVNGTKLISKFYMEKTI